MAEGKLFIIGAGPGDPELLTIKASRCLEVCDVLFHDASIAEEILCFAPEGTEKISLSNESDGETISKAAMDEIIKAVKAGKTVGVLLEGDPFIFGVGAEVARKAVEAGCKFELVPGITSASAAAVYAGIPLTYRGYASTLGFAIGHSSLNRRYTDIDWPRVAIGMQTLIFFINEDSLSMVIEKLLANGRDPRTPAAIVSSGTRKDQSTIAGNLGELRSMTEDERQIKKIPMPAVLIVGDVVGLRQELKWFE